MKQHELQADRFTLTLTNFSYAPGVTTTSVTLGAVRAEFGVRASSPISRTQRSLTWGSPPRLRA